MKFQSSPRRLALAVITLSALPAAGQVSNEDIILLSNDGMSGDRFGWCVAISGTTVVCGSSGDDDNGPASGSAYLFNTATGLQVAKLLPDDGSAQDLFGHATAISGSTIIVGAYLDDDKGTDSGSAYLFDSNTGHQLAKLTSNDAADNDRFGFSVAISDDIAIVGAVWDDDSGDFSGSVYLFQTTTGQQFAKLTSSDGEANDQFGMSVAISGTLVIVGAPFDDDHGRDSGSAYLFDITTGKQVAKLLPNDGARHDRFGYSVAISGTTAAVGSPFDDDNGLDSGSAYIFDITTGQQIAKLLPNDGAHLDEFGHSVAISGLSTVVGVPSSNNIGFSSGSAYLFDNITGNQIAKLLPKEGDTFDLFGYSVAISGTTAIIGAPAEDSNGDDSGSAYIIRTAPCFPDLTGDGTLDFFDVSAFLTAFAASDPTADFNADGLFNFFDVSEFMTAYLAGCP